MSTAVIRVKRLLEEDPLDTLILNCKKRKVSDDESKDEELTTVIKLAGTVECDVNPENEDFLKHLYKKATKAELEIEFKKHNTQILDKLRDENKEQSTNNRYKVVNCFRNSSNRSECSQATNNEYTVYDIEKDLSEDTKSSSSRNLEPKYVYDLYYTNSDYLGDSCFEEYVSIYPLHDPLMFQPICDKFSEQYESADDSDDSNAENNWRNSYPDECDMDSINDDDIVNAVQNLDIDNNLSSDEGEEGFVYSIDSEAAGFEEDIDDSDVRRYGEMYARFKKRNKSLDSGNSHNLYCGDIGDEDNDENYSFD